jgi:hypothetical protein
MFHNLVDKLFKVVYTLFMVAVRQPSFYKEDAMKDLTFNFGAFNETTIKVAAISDKGRDFLAASFGDACVSVEIPKSKGEDFAVFASRKGLNW